VVLARRGLREAPGRPVTSLQEAVRALPSESFRACLSRVRPDSQNNHILKRPCENQSPSCISGTSLQVAVRVSRNGEHLLENLKTLPSESLSTCLSLLRAEYKTLMGKISSVETR